VCVKNQYNSDKKLTILLVIQVQVIEVGDSSGDEGEEENGLKACSFDGQASTMLDFFKPSSILDQSNVKTDDKKRKKTDEEAILKAPPAKKRIEEEENKVENKSLAKAVVAGDEKVGGSGCKKSSIGSFFRAISKTKYIEESEKQACIQTHTVKALVHSPSQEEIGSSSQERSGTVPRTTSSSKSKKRRNSKYVRRSDETDVIQILEEEIEAVDDVVDGGLKPPAAVAQVETPTTAPKEQHPTKISTKQLFKGKTGKQHKKQRPATSAAPHEDEDTVDIDFPVAVVVAATSASEKSSNIAKPAEVNLFKEKPLTRKRKNQRRRGVKDLHYDSDSIDVDVLATFSAKTFAPSTGHSPPMENSTDSTNAFSVLMKKPLLKSAKDELASPVGSLESQCNDDKSNEGCRLVDKEEIQTSSKLDQTTKAVNAFSKLMAPKNKENALSEMPKIDSTEEKEKDQSRCCPDNDNGAGKNNGIVVVPTSSSAAAARISAGGKKRGRPRKRPRIVASDDILNSSANDFVDTPPEMRKTKSRGSIKETEGGAAAAAAGCHGLQEEEEEEEAAAAPGGRRKSERIKVNLEVRKAQVFSQEEVDVLLDEEEDETLDTESNGAGDFSHVKDKPQKRKRKTRAKRLRQTSSTEESPDSDCIQVVESNNLQEGAAGERDDEITIEKVIEKPIASIFAGRRKKGQQQQQVVIREDPEKVAARKAFLLSSVPDSLRSHVDRQRRGDDGSFESVSLLTPFASTIGHITQRISDDDDDGKYRTTSRVGPKLRKFASCDDLDGDFEGKMATSMAGYHGTLVANAILERQGDVTTTTSVVEELPSSKLCAISKQTSIESRRTSSASSRTATIDPKIQRLRAPQIYRRLLTISHEAEETLSASKRFPVTKLFARYLERKIEADSLEEEARTKNVSLNEIEEERNKGGARRRLRRRRKQSGSKAKKSKKKNEAAVSVSRLNSKLDAGVKYEPNLAGSMQWTMKYSPQCTDDIIGNSAVVRELASWLGEWEARDLKRRRRLRQGCNDAGDDYSNSSSSCYEDDDSMGDSGEDEELPNTALLVGPSGVGKTATVYALAHEMGFKVLEVNASASRNGRQVLANLREATQSHDVRKQREMAFAAAAAETKQQMSANVDRTAIILFEDIDLIFGGDTDEGFYGAVNSLIATTKRPILLTTSNPSFLRMQMGGKAKVLKLLPQAFHFGPEDPEIAARHLQLLALVEGFAIDLKSLTSLCTLYNGNVSRAMMALQCWTTSSSTTLGKSDDSDRLDLSSISSSGVSTSSGEVAIVAGEADWQQRDATIVNWMSLSKREQQMAVAESSSLAVVGKQEALMSDLSLHLLSLVGQQSSSSSRISSLLLSSSAVGETLLSGGMASIFEWHRYNMLPFPTQSSRVQRSKVRADCAFVQNGKEANSVGRGGGRRRVNQNSSRSFFAADSDDELTTATTAGNVIDTANSAAVTMEEEETKPKDGESLCSSEAAADSKKGKKAIAMTMREPDCQGSNEDVGTSRATAMNLLSKCAEAASDFLLPRSLCHHRGGLQDEECWISCGCMAFDPLQNEIMSYVHWSTMSNASSVHQPDDKLKQQQSPRLNTKKEDDDLIMGAVESRDTMLDSKYSHTLHLAQRKVMEDVDTDVAFDNRAAFMDFLPVVREMARAEETRKENTATFTADGKQLKRSRTSRFIHYFNSINVLAHDDPTIAMLCNAFSS
jgi:DNA polymerase III delta prime subunit